MLCIPCVFRWRVTSDVAFLETYKNIKALNLQPLVSHRRLDTHQAELRLHWSLSLASAFSTVFSQKRFLTVHFPLASHAGVFRGTWLSSLPTRDERRAPLKTPAWEANLPRDSVKFCVPFKGFVWKIGKSWDQSSWRNSSGLPRVRKVIMGQLQNPF